MGGDDGGQLLFSDSIRGQTRAPKLDDLMLRTFFYLIGISNLRALLGTHKDE